MRSRMQYYDEVIRSRLKSPLSDPIPVVASHVGYSGVDQLNDQLANYLNGLEANDFSVVANFNHWHINLCNEDPEVIIKSRGIIGICFDQRIMGQIRKGKRDSKDLLRTNLESMVDAVRLSSHLEDDEKPYIWECLSIGTDFDGYIDPLNKYPTALHFEVLEKDLIEIIQGLSNEKGGGRAFHTQNT